MSPRIASPGASLEGLGFARDPLDRASDRREDADAVMRLRTRGDARAILIARDMPVLARRAENYLTNSRLRSTGSKRTFDRRLEQS